MKKRLLILTSMIIIMSSLWSYAELVDPTKPYGFRQSVLTLDSRPGFTLSAILTSTNRKFAVINGETVHVGDTISDVKVINIQPEFVELEDTKGKFVIHLYQSVREVADK